MNSLTVFELLKVWRKRSFLISVTVILLINIFLLWYTNLSDSTEPELSSYKAFQKDIGSMTENEKQEYIEKLYQDIQGVCLVRNVLYMQALGGEMGEVLSRQEMEANPGVFEKYYDVFQNEGYLNYTASLEQEEALIGELYAEMQKVCSYYEYLDSIRTNQEKLNGISIFSADNEESFSSRNIEKSAADYSGMHTVKIVFFPSKGLVCAMQSSISDVLLILSVFLFAGGLIYEEKEKRLFFVTRATVCGRGKSIAAKLAALGLYCMAITVLIYGSNLLFFAGTAGIGSLFRSIQSVAPFMESNLRISIFAYIGLSMLTKAAVLFFIGAFIVCASILSGQSFMSYFVGAIVLAVNLILYQFIPAWSSFNWLKFLNIYGLLRTENLYGSYLNFDFFGYPISRLASSLIALCIYIVVSVIAAAVLFLKCRNLELKKISIPNVLILKPHDSLFHHESYKILVMNRAMLVLLLFSVLLGYRYFSTQYSLSAKESYYKSMMMQLEGACTPEKETLIKAEKQRYDDAFEQIERIDEMTASGELEKAAGESMKSVYYSEVTFYPSFQRVLAQYEYIKEKGGEFVYDTGYLWLFGKMDDSFLWDLILLSACIILAFSNVFAVEYQKKSWCLLSATGRGKQQIVRKKAELCMIVTVVMGLLPWICRGIQINRFYPLRGLSASLRNIPAYQGTGMDIPIVLWIFASVVMQILALLMITLAVLFLSEKLKVHLQTLFAGVLLLLIPLILKAMGFDFAGWFSLLPLYIMPGYC